jgi:signal transduction histidine kinase
VLNVIQINDPKDKNIAIMPINLYEFAPSVITLAEKRTRTADRVQLDMQQSQQIIYQNADFLEQIIVNLLTNALKFSQEAVLFQLSTTPDQKLIIRVKDQGIGIPPDEHESVFDVLFRGSNLDEVSGNGMGLALVKQSVGLLDGTIELHSTLNVGTEFIVTIPLKTNPHSPTNGDYPAYHP